LFWVGGRKNFMLEEIVVLRANNEVLPIEILRYGAYICLKDGARKAVAASDVGPLVKRLGLQNEFEPQGGHPTEAVAFLRRVKAVPGDIVDDGLLEASAIIHVASPASSVVVEFCREIERLFGATLKPLILRGVARPMSYTGTAMHNFAYAHQVIQQPGRAMPNAFLVPMSKTAEWWNKHWLERHTYFLPRYDENAKMISEGHALAAAAGIPCLLRRTYRGESVPAPEGTYDFLNYFECADADVPTFHSVCANLRDVKKNPEWKFVREGPAWQGLRVATWAEMFT
jgi:hypothetical protein